jgi:hypothetical protein
MNNVMVEIQATNDIVFLATPSLKKVVASSTNEEKKFSIRRSMTK